MTAIIKARCRKGYRCKGTRSNWALDPKYYMSGSKVVVRHSNGTKTVYDHTGAAGLAYVGKIVRAGTPIGRIYATDRKCVPGRTCTSRSS